jgi:hypothetical protein
MESSHRQVMMSTKERSTASLFFLYFEDHKPVDKSEDFVVPMMAYDLVLVLLWLEVRNPEIDWTNGGLAAL